MSYYEDRIKVLEARIEEMALLNRMKAVSVEASLMIRIGELNDENARLKAEVERLTKAGDAMADKVNYHYAEMGAWGSHPIVQAWREAKGVQS